MIAELTREYITVSLTAFLISVLLTPIIRKVCQQRQVLDFPIIPRKIHATPIPRLGGIAIYLAFFLPLFAMLFIDNPSAALFHRHFDVLGSLFVTGTLVFAIGVYDDIRGATVTQKFLVQIMAAIIIYFLGFKIDMIAMPFAGAVKLGILGLPVTILWIVGVTNAINFTDGIDGLACGVGFFSVSTIFILSLFLHHKITAFFAAALAGGLFGFALYNFAPASIFMGDSGSLFIGFIIAAISLHGSQKSSTAVVLLIPIVALGVPITDTVLAIIRRLGHGLSPFSADRDHIHHKLLDMGLSSRQVALVLYGVCILLGITALSMTAVNNRVLALILMILSVMTIIGIKVLGYTTDMVQINSRAKERIHQKQRLMQRQKFAEEILAEIAAAADMPTLQKGMIRYFESLEFDVGALRVIGDHLTSHNTISALNFHWNSTRYEEQIIPADHVWSIRIPIIIDRIKHGELHIGQYDGIEVSPSSFEHMVFIERLSSAVRHSLARILFLSGKERETDPPYLA